MKYLFHAAYGWLVFTGTMHFLIDVVSQYFRGVRAPSPETTLYYGLNSSFALGQVMLGVLGLWLAWRAPETLREPLPIAISVLAGIAWLALALFFMEYRPPRMMAGIYCALIIAAAIHLALNRSLVQPR